MTQMTFRWLGQARSQAQKRRFARTGRADNCDKLARLYFQMNVFKSLYLSAKIGDKGFGDILKRKNAFCNSVIVF